MSLLKRDNEPNLNNVMTMLAKHEQLPKRTGPKNEKNSCGGR